MRDSLILVGMMFAASVPARGAASILAPAPLSVAQGVLKALDSQVVGLPAPPAALDEWLDLLKSPDLAGAAVAPLAASLKTKGYTEIQLAAGEISPKDLRSAFDRTQRRFEIRTERMRRRADDLYVALLIGDAEGAAAVLGTEGPARDALEARLMDESHAVFLTGNRSASTSPKERLSELRQRTMVTFEMQKDRVNAEAMARHVATAATRLGLTPVDARNYLGLTASDQKQTVVHAAAQERPALPIGLERARSAELEWLIGHLQEMSDSVHMVPVPEKMGTWLYGEKRQVAAFVSEDEFAVFLEIHNPAAFKGEPLQKLKRSCSGATYKYGVIFCRIFKSALRNEMR